MDDLLEGLVSSEDLIAADKFRETVVPRADGYSAWGRFPLWHGWVIVDAYLAGLKAGREERNDEQAVAE